MIGTYVMGAGNPHRRHHDQGAGAGTWQTRTARFWVYAVDPRTGRTQGRRRRSTATVPTAMGSARASISPVQRLPACRCLCRLRRAVPTAGQQPPRVTHVACFAHARRNSSRSSTRRSRRSPKRRCAASPGSMRSKPRSPGKPAEIRLAAAQSTSQRLLDAFKTWADEQRRRVSGKTALGKAFDTRLAAGRH